MSNHFVELLGVLVAIGIGTRVLGLAAQRVGQPSVLGELVAGIILGPSVLGVLNPSDAVISAFAELGVLVLLFMIGMETDIRSLARVGRSAGVVALVGVVLPFGFGYVVAHALGLSSLTSVVCGATLTATSIGISARVLSDIGRLNSDEGQIVLGAAVIDDVIGLIILSVVSTMLAGAALTVGAVTTTTVVAIGFLVLAMMVGSRTVPPVFRYIDRLNVAGTIGAAALVFAFLLAWLAARSGSAMIIGAFAAGLVLHSTPQREHIEKATTSIGHFFVPIFFASVGAAVDISFFGDMAAVKIALALFIVGFIGKFLAGFSPVWFRGNKALIGVAMVPRGEVGLIFAQTGAAAGVLDPKLFSAVTMVVLATTFIAPPLLGRFSKLEPRDDNARGAGGVDDLVAGSGS
ncbi:MAG: cation:proton antiporter [Gemmatimonadaceae bacterium]|nr:cation:proton antiporter [Gemmatimonadaceae bacterium]